MSTINHLPELEKPREKAFAFGLQALSNGELLALLIRCGTKDRNAVQVANDLLETCGGIGKMSACSFQRFMKVKGVSKIKALELSAIFELMRRMLFETMIEKDVIRSPDDLVRWLNITIGFLDKEEFIVIFLDQKHHVISYEILFHGTINMAAVYIREIMKEALLRGAPAIIVAHNHPSQSVEPSFQDVELTKQIKQAGKILGIDVLDHMIVSGHEYYSFMVNGDVLTEVQ